MALTAQEQFQTLLQQLQYEEVPASLQETALTKLAVHKQSKIWQFHFEMPQLPPVQEMAALVARMQTAFANIAQTTSQLHLTEQPTAQQIVDYWTWVLQQHQNEPGAFRQAFAHVLPQIAGNQLDLTFDTAVWANYARQTGLPIIEGTYKKLGVGYQLPFNILVDEQLAAESHAQVMAQRAAQDQQLAEMAKVQIEQAAKQRQSAPRNGGGGGNNPGALGRKIAADAEITKMGDIETEERSVIVEGYVFDVEVRVLKSERQLLTMKVTDYTSSFILKKFSRDENDEAFFADMKPGTWIRARGPIQQDDFVRDLTMTAYDMEIIKHAPRLDPYEGEQKRIELHT
ncbi:MAG: PolC-type DNA polymerase III N-terminal domain-containing protein, partial [Weissella cibaria]